MTLANIGEDGHLAEMTMPITLATTAVLVALTLFAGWRGARPPDLIRGVRMIPWRAIMVFSAAGVLLMVVHLANLVGVHTGR